MIERDMVTEGLVGLYRALSDFARLIPALDQEFEDAAECMQEALPRILVQVGDLANRLERIFDAKEQVND